MGKVEISIYFCVTTVILKKVTEMFLEFKSTTNHMNFVQITDFAMATEKLNF